MFVTIVLPYWWCLILLALMILMMIELPKSYWCCWQQNVVDQKSQQPMKGEPTTVITSTFPSLLRLVLWLAPCPFRRGLALWPCSRAAIASAAPLAARALSFSPDKFFFFILFVVFSYLCSSPRWREKDQQRQKSAVFRHLNASWCGCGLDPLRRSDFLRSFLL